MWANTFKMPVAHFCSMALSVLSASNIPQSERVLSIKALIFSTIVSEVQFCVCATLLHAVSICCYRGKLAVHGLKYARFCG
jgi:hypothetical protein